MCEMIRIFIVVYNMSYADIEWNQLGSKMPEYYNKVKSQVNSGDRYCMKEYNPSDDNMFNFSDMVNVSGSKFPSSSFQYDKRFDNLKKKRENDMNANKQRFCNPHEVQQPTMYSYENPVKITNYRGYQPWNEIEAVDDENLNKIIEQSDRINKRDNRMITPYDMEDTRADAPNIDIDNYLRSGVPKDSSKKSVGFPSAHEHYFQYISDDMQIPDHVVMERGYPSRDMNRETARPCSRDVPWDQ